MLSAEPKAGTDNTQRYINYSGYSERPNSIIVLLYVVAVNSV